MGETGVSCHRAVSQKLQGQKLNYSNVFRVYIGLKHIVLNVSLVQVLYLIEHTVKLVGLLF